MQQGHYYYIRTSLGSNCGIMQAVLARLTPVPASYLKQLATDGELFGELPRVVQRQVRRALPRPLRPDLPLTGVPSGLMLMLLHQSCTPPPLPLRRRHRRPCPCYSPSGPPLVNCKRASAFSSPYIQYIWTGDPIPGIICLHADVKHPADNRIGMQVWELDRKLLQSHALSSVAAYTGAGRI